MGYNAGTNALVEGSREDVVVEAMPRTDAAAVMKELFTMNRDGFAAMDHSLLLTVFSIDIAQQRERQLCGSHCDYQNRCESLAIKFQTTYLHRDTRLHTQTNMEQTSICIRNVCSVLLRYKTKITLPSRLFQVQLSGLQYKIRIVIITDCGGTSFHFHEGNIRKANIIHVLLILLFGT